MGKTVNTRNLMSDQRNTPANGPKETKWDSPRSLVWYASTTPAALQYRIPLWEKLQNSVQRTIAPSFPFPFPVVCPPPPPSKHAPTAKADTVCSQGEKC